MGKVGLINFHRSINYGAVLQAYALNESIKKMGYESTTIDHHNQLIEKSSDLNPGNGSDLRSILFKTLTYSRSKEKIAKFEEFRAKYINPDEITTLTGQNDQLNIYEKFITGSDQVWNFALTRFDRAYFLDFVSDSKKKNSYGASFGFDRIPDEYLNEYKKLLEDFNHISVREEQGAKIVEDLLNRSAEVVLDPTMLLSKNDWINVTEESCGKGNYVLIYQMVASQSMLDFAVDLSKQTDCEIVYISDALRKRIKATYARAVGPQEFLGLFKNAKYIVTNSFHGTAFAINFNKLFFTEMLPPPANVNSRLENILDTFNLRSRQIINGKNNNIFNEIDYIKINEKLESERQRSLDFLKRVLEE